MITSKGFKEMITRRKACVKITKNNIAIGTTNNYISSHAPQRIVLHRIIDHHSYPYDPIFIKVTGGKFEGTRGKLVIHDWNVKVQVVKNSTEFIPLPGCRSFEFVVDEIYAFTNAKPASDPIDWFGNKLEVGDAIAVSSKSMCVGIYVGMDEVTDRIKVQLAHKKSKNNATSIITAGNAARCINLSKLNTEKARMIMLAKVIALD